FHGAIARTGPTVEVGAPGPVARGGRPAATGAPARFEVEFRVEAPDERLNGLRETLLGLGDSVVIVRGRGRHRVHVHTDRPEDAVAAGRAAGRVGDVRTEALTEVLTEAER